MKAFTINADNNVIAYASLVEARADLSAGGIAFSSHAELTDGAATWPASRLAEIWNTLPGVVAVTKFTDRKTALRRMWSAIEKLEPPSPVQTKTVAAAAPAREGAKKAAVLALLHRAEGATVPEIMAEIGWQAHSVRGFLSTLKKRGAGIRTFRRPTGERAYALDAGAAKLAAEVQ